MITTLLNILANSVLSHASLQYDFNHLDIHHNCQEKIVSMLNDFVLSYAAINIIPNYPPHGVYKGQHRGFSYI